MLRKYWERGFSVIPVNGKATAGGYKDELGHDKWNETRQPEWLIDEYEKIKSTGWALVTGKISRVIALDIDSVSKDILDLCPPSPCRKVGRRGETRFYRWNDQFDQRRKFFRPNTGDPETGKDKEGVELLCNGAYTVMPGSIHPETGKPYVWLGVPLDSIDIEDLPELSPEAVQEIEAYISGFCSDSASESVELSGKFSHHDASRCPHGSHDRLKALAAGLVAGGTSFYTAVMDLIRYDETHHFPVSYFKDKTRSECRADPVSNATKFYANILNSINRNRIRRGLAPQTPSELPTISVESIIKPEAKPTDSFPELPGLLGIFKSGILHKIRRDQEDLAIGGALALGSVLCAHRFSIGGVLAHTKLYILNIGKTGVGKDAPFKFIKAVLSHPDMRDDNLLGFENYSSKAAILETLTKQKVRIDLRDEFKDTFIAIANNKGASGNEISSFLNQHFTDSGWYGGHYTKTDKWAGACFDPSITLLAGIQPQELISNATLSNFSDGFMGRLLTFMASTKAKHVGRQHNSLTDVVEQTIAEIKRVIPKLEYETKGIITEKDNPMERWTPRLTPLSLDRNYAKHRDEVDRYLADQEDKLEDKGKEQERALLTRQNMFIERITTIIAACSGDRTITIEHARLAEKLVSISQARSLEVMGVSGMNKLELDAERVMAKIKQDGFLTRGDISYITKRNKREMSDLIDTMLERDWVSESKADKPARNGKVTMIYHLNKAH